MEILGKLPPDVLIYIQNVRKHFTGNESVREYFGVDNDEDEFFNTVIEQARKNFEENGAPELSIEQFETLRVNTSKPSDIYGEFMSLGRFGLISMN